MNEKTVNDGYFGHLQWDPEMKWWHCAVTMMPHGEVDLVLPPDYIDSEEIRMHIWETLRIIERNEASFRQRAADELYATRTYHMYWPEERPFDRDIFANKMHLGQIEFNTEFPDSALTLGYEYGSGMEHGIMIYLTWDGLYQYTSDF